MTRKKLKDLVGKAKVISVFTDAPDVGNLKVYITVPEYLSKNRNLHNITDEDTEYESVLTMGRFDDNAMAVVREVLVNTNMSVTKLEFDHKLRISETEESPTGRRVRIFGRNLHIHESEEDHRYHVIDIEKYESFPTKSAVWSEMSSRETFLNSSLYGIKMKHVKF